MDALITRTYGAFAEKFGHKAAGIVAAPGRINLIGEHTDYNDGFVLPMAINRFVAVAFEPTAERSIEIWSEHAGDMGQIDLGSLRSSGKPTWLVYASGMAWALEQEGIAISGARLAVCADLPVGAGVSSSAAFEIGIGKALAAATGVEVEPADMALMAHRSDHEFVGIPSGIMDQFASACCRAGHGLLLDCRERTFEHVPLPSECVFVVVDTGRRRELVGGEYAERVSSCRVAVEGIQKRFPEITSLRDARTKHLEAVRGSLNERTYRRARHVVSEMSRPHEMAAALRASNLERAGRLMHDSHHSLATDYEVSCTELDAAVEMAGEHPACFGARLTGAGFGGCAIALCKRSGAEDFVTYISSRYRERFGMGEAYVVEASSGARVVS